MVGKNLPIVTFLFLLFAAVVARPVLAADAEPAAPAGKITLLVAASLADLFKKAKIEFEQKYPGTEVLIETGASLTLIRKVSDLQSAADVIVVADRALIPTHLVPKFADTSIDFLTEKIGLVVGEKAKYADRISADNWIEILMKPDVEFGVSDPMIAPVGYRAMMVWKLAEQHYQQPGLYQRLRTRLPQKNIRPNAVALLTLLKSGELDYIFDYPSLARQHGLRVIELPAQINLGDPRLADLYKTVSVEVPGTEPGVVKTIKGEPIVYSIAPLKAAPNPKMAHLFLEFMLKARGPALMAQLGMTPLVK